MYLLSLAISFLISVSSALPAPEKRQVAPSVQLSYANIIGTGSTGIDTFKGIPYAQPPIGSLRLKPPQRITSHLGTIQATDIPTACPQGSKSAPASLPLDVRANLFPRLVSEASTPIGEDCLTINVQRPSNSTKNSKLPVLFWIYGGAFQGGSTQSFDASQLLQTSISNHQPIIYVAVNYRLGGFGFLGGSEILRDGSSNLGLLDQRLGLQWVADNIAAFGGDPDKVTIWGESAGSISAFDQMALYGGQYHYKDKPLFRGAIMDSGSITPADPVDSPRAQSVYNQVVLASGCANSTHTLTCLRNLPYDKFLSATLSLPSLSSYNSIAIPYLPRPDHHGGVLPLSPELLASQGLFAPIPFIIGDQEDEGTVFSFGPSNLSTTADLENYFHTIIFPDATSSQISTLISSYPDDPASGSPFGTGAANNVYPQYKRLAALVGDLSFTLSRRLFLSYALAAHPLTSSYSYLASYGYGTPVVGTSHGSDVAITYGETLGFPQESIQDYYINFVNTLDPNGKGWTGENDSSTGNGTLQWPIWGKGRQMVNLGKTQNTLMTDDFRENQFGAIREMVGSLHL
ncbi:lipase [Sclerotinia borealis F-4128]|uniref:Carboxylic ester hydrolase n=1 Tax=Sclerotinia borealis (strain F-4128) TaxID=1432307 RepID=W9C253_SCLBF|nr:lipase [Sclerotinia borealis F-4128]